MAKYVARPVEVEAFRIAKIEDLQVTVREAVSGSNFLVEFGIAHILLLENGERVQATEAMQARMTPAVGDYWVIQSDGYIYLNPNDVFERKYRPA